MRAWCRRGWPVWEHLDVRPDTARKSHARPPDVLHWYLSGWWLDGAIEVLAAPDRSRAAGLRLSRQPEGAVFPEASAVVLRLTCPAPVFSDG